MSKGAILFRITIALLCFATMLSASEIKKLDMSDLEKMSSHIVLGEVISVASDKTGLEEITVKIRAIIKGTSNERQFAIQLQTNGVRDFDPSLKNGDCGVFFLKSLSNGRGVKAFYGSIALFTKDNFK